MPTNEGSAAFSIRVVGISGQRANVEVGNKLKGGLTKADPEGAS